MPRFKLLKCRSWLVYSLKDCAIQVDVRFIPGQAFAARSLPSGGETTEVVRHGETAERQCADCGVTAISPSPWRHWRRHIVRATVENVLLFGGGHEG